MTFRVIVIPADIDQPIHEEAYAREPGEGNVLTFLQNLVGGYVERVVTRSLIDWARRLEDHTDRRHYRPNILVDEEGLLKGLPLNDRATVFYHNGEYGLHGDAVVVWENDPGDGGNWVSLPPTITVDNLGEEIALRLLGKE